MSKVNNVFDYIVVGVGTAGSAIAKLLSDDFSTSVFAIHDGQDLDLDKQIALSSNIFSTINSALYGSDLYKIGNTISQKNLNNRQMLWVMATPLGGASSINSSVYSRASNIIFDNWEKVAGSSWSKNRILDIACRLEKYDGQTENVKMRGFNGPLNIRQSKEVTPFADKLTKAISKALDIPIIMDYNDPNFPIGATNFLQYCQAGKNGEFRISSSILFLNSNIIDKEGNGIGSRKLKVSFNSIGVKVLFADDIACGVEYLENDILKTVYAKKGIIISAGLFSSPFLLRSGIGPKNLLESLNIPLIYNNSNVGKNLSDHYYLPFIFQTNSDDTPFPPINNNNVFNQIAFLPDINNKDRASSIVSVNIDSGVVLLSLSLAPCYSKGEISITSKDVRDLPMLDLGIFSDEKDLNLLKDIVQIQMKKIAQELQEIDPNCRLIDPNLDIFQDSSAIVSFIKERLLCYQEFQGHCKMAPADEGGVVDSNCKVYGVQNLYVADNSIIPVSTDGGSMSAAYYIAINFCEKLLNRKLI